MSTLRDLDDREERTRALRALLAAPFLRVDEPAYALVRRHERELASSLQVTYGYQLEVGSTAARASGLPTPDGLRRPLRIRPASASGRKRAPDEWPALSDRACTLLLLTLVALERGGVQTAIAELAQEVERAGADVEPPVTVDFRQRSEVRQLFSIVHRAGVRVRHHGDFDEAGVQILRDLEACYSAVPWRFDAEALCGALGRALTPAEKLEDSVRRLSCGVPEEMVIDDLVADLHNAAR